MALELYRFDERGNAHLTGSRCGECSRVSYPARAICGWCGSEQMESVPLGRRGRIKASAVVHHAPEGFSAPYVLATVALEEGPLLFCPITGCTADEGSVLPGTPVQLVIAPARPGGIPVVQYRPVGG